MKKVRLDMLLVERGLTDSRERAKAVIMSGSVLVGGVRADKPGMQVFDDALVEVRGLPEYVSRGGLKLEKALRLFGTAPEGKVCLDCGASTGGFTDCLLKNGARLVYAIDVGYGQLAWSIRNDPRVVTMERTNIRHVTSDMLDIKPELAVIDVSFISLSIVLPVIRKLLTEDGEVICLIKPQFEAGREKVGKKGVVRDPQTHKIVLETFALNAARTGFIVKAMTYSPVKGPEGNIEFLSLLGSRGESGVFNIDAIVSEAHEKLGVSKSEPVPGSEA